MADAAITFDVAQSVDVLLDLAAKRTFNRVVAFQNRRQHADLLIGQITSLLVFVNGCFVAEVTSGLVADAI